MVVLWFFDCFSTGFCASYIFSCGYLWLFYVFNYFFLNWAHLCGRLPHFKRLSRVHVGVWGSSHTYLFATLRKCFASAS